MAPATASSASTRSLLESPTWALAVVCFCFISISIAMEHSIQLLINWLKRHQKKSLIDAIEKLKSELMLLGFMSLLLAAIQRHISSICIPTHVADTMLPCRKPAQTTTTENLEVYGHLESGNSLKIFAIEGAYEEKQRRLASAGSANSASCSYGKVALISQEGIHQLHIFIFVLAMMQIVYSIFTMALGRAKMRRWKAWEKETQTTEYQVANDSRRFRYTRQTTFGRRHVTTCTEQSALLWIRCFFRQFFNSVAKVDYLTLRHGFISAHLSNHSKFNFQKYIQRSLEDDFRVVVGISPLMWFIVVIFLLLDVHGWHVYLWVSFIPLIVVLIIGAKLEVIVAKMALQLKEQNTVIRGAPLVQLNDELFWFSHPRFVLTLVHFTLFTNAFELAFFVWVMIEFGVDSCYHENTAVIVTRVVLAVTVQIICSYITLPLYALVTQMGSQFKSALLEEQIAEILRQWHTEVRMKRKVRQSSHYSRSPNSTIGSTRNTSPIEVPSLPNPRPTPTLAVITPLPSRSEITEVQEEPNLASIPSRVVTLELPIINRKS